MITRMHLFLAGFLALTTQVWPGEPVRIGVLLSMHGPAGSLGKRAWEGIRDAGRNRPQVLGRPVQMIRVDSRSDPSEAVSAVFRLVEKEKVVAVIGDVTSSCSLAASAYTEQRGIILVSLSGPVAGHRPRGGYTVWTGTRGAAEGSFAARVCRRTLGYGRATIVQDNSQEDSIVSATRFEEAFRAAGGGSVSRVGVHAGQTDMEPVVRQLQRSRPEVVFVPLFAVQCALLKRQSAEMGFDAAFMATDRADLEELIGVGGAAVHGMYVTCRGVDCARTPLHSVACSVRAGFLKGAGSNPWAAAGAHAYGLLLDAMERAGSTDGDEFRREAFSIHEAPHEGEPAARNESDSPADRFVVRTITLARPGE